jgi:hypothetical protein
LLVLDARLADAGLYDLVASTDCQSIVSDPIPVVVCTADFNGISGVGVQDLFLFLELFFREDPRADVNELGGISVQDIFDFLAAYFSGCP